MTVGRVRSITATLAVGILAVLAVVGPGPTRAVAATEPAPRPPTAVATAARSLLGSLAPGYTVAGPVEWVRTTRRAYERLDGDREAVPDRELYVVQVRGRFTCGACSRPYGAPVQTGAAVGSAVPVDGSDGAGGRIGPPLDLSQLGTVHTFPIS